MSSAQRRWIRIAATNELPAECVKEFSASGLHIVVANHEGRFYAFQAECPHMGGPLREGRLVGARIDCPWHHYLFELSTGENFYPRSVYPDDLAPSVASLRIFPIREVNGHLEIEIVQE